MSIQERGCNPPDQGLQYLAQKYGQEIEYWLVGEPLVVNGYYDANFWQGISNQIKWGEARLVYDTVDDPYNQGSVEAMYLGAQDMKTGVIQRLLAVVPPPDRYGQRPQPMEPNDYRHITDFLYLQGVVTEKTANAIDVLYTQQYNQMAILSNASSWRSPSTVPQLRSATDMLNVPQIGNGGHTEKRFPYGWTIFGVSLLALYMLLSQTEIMTKDGGDSKLTRVYPLIAELYQTLAGQAELRTNPSGELAPLPYEDIGFSFPEGPMGSGPLFTGRIVGWGDTVEVIGDDKRFTVVGGECVGNPATNKPNCTIVVNNEMQGVTAPGRVFPLSENIQIVVDDMGRIIVMGGILQIPDSE